MKVSQKWNAQESPRSSWGLQGSDPPMYAESPAMSKNQSGNFLFDSDP
jgi:hypothetical protein